MYSTNPWVGSRVYVESAKNPHCSVNIPYRVKVEVIEEVGPRKIILYNVTRRSRRGAGKGQSARLENE
jgi:hypothetical protein